MFTQGMEFDLGEDVNALRDMVHRWAQDRVRPLAAATDRDNAFPSDLWTEMGDLGLLGITVPEEWGGAGLGYLAHVVAVEEIARASASISLSYGAHSNLCVNQIKLNGSDDQRAKYLPALCSGRAVGALAMSEPSAGSDVVSMKLRAEKRNDHYRLNGNKYWITNAPDAQILVVYAKTDPDAGSRGITAFIVERDMPGVEVISRSRFMGLRALYNGVIRFTDVKVPVENVLGDEGKGLRLALTTLNTGRLTLPAACTGASKRALKMAREFSRDREQWGSNIGKHEAIAQKVAFIASHTFAMEAISFYPSMLVDLGGADIRLEAAMCKMFCSEGFWKIIDETMQIRSGRGYETAGSLRERGEPGVAVERAMRDSRINMIFEGTSEIMRLFISREALDPHLRRAGSVLNPRAPLGDKIADGLKAGLHYFGWYLKLMDPVPRRFHVHRQLAGHLRFVNLQSRKLARSLFHAMGRHQAALERKQAQLGRFVEVGSELFAMAAAVSRADTLHSLDPEKYTGVIELADIFCRHSRRRIKSTFRAMSSNDDVATYKFPQRVVDGEYEWLEEGAVDFPFE